MQDLSVDQVAKSLELLGITNPTYNIPEIVSMINSDPQFDPESRVLYYFHRELDTRKSDTQKRQGFVQSVMMKNLNASSVLCLDSAEFKIDYGDELEVRLCCPHQNLTAVNMTIDDML